jgi:monoamine oxidase
MEDHMVERSSEPGVLDVAIVGGGVSGLYSGWRLLTADAQRSQTLRAMVAGRDGRPLKVGLFEGSRRLGGRLLSLTPPGMPHIRCELGGMRYMSSQALARSLIENKLKLATRPFAVAEPENIAYLRRRHLRLGELTDPSKAPYNVDWAERGRDPGSLISYAVDQIVPGVTSLHGPPLRALLAGATFEGRHLYEYGFWNLLARTLSREAYAFATETSGYDTATLNWNAADTILLNFDFAPDVTFNALVDGYETLPRTLDQLFQAAGGVVRLGCWLRSFDAVRLPDQSVGVTMTVRDAETGRDEAVLARALILAMPRRSLELLDQTGAVLDAGNAEVQALIRSVTPIPLFKMAVCYHSPWWEAVGVTKGRSLTDLPLRQCYYWGVEGEQPGADPKNRNAALLATYDDGQNVGFWAGLRDQRAEPRFEPKPNAHAVAHPGSDEWREHRAPKAMVEEIQRQLMEMHGLSFAPAPYDAAFRDWGDDPFGGGVNFWNIHVNSREAIPRIAKPTRDAPVYICGEAYSSAQGWVEGALETAELVLQDHFQLPAPDWVTGE